MKPCNENIVTVMQYAHELLSLADKGDNERDDDGCGVLYGIVRDNAYKIIELAQREQAAHDKSGKWG